MKLSEELINIFDYLGEKLGIAIDWSSENVIPYLQDLCQRYIDYEISISVFWCIVALLILIGNIVFHKAIYKHKDWGIEKRTYGSDDNFGRCLLYVLVGFAYLIPVIVIGFDIVHIIHCIYLPELEIYEYVTTLMETI
jgi:hypothetical protein